MVLAPLLASPSDTVHVLYVGGVKGQVLSDLSFKDVGDEQLDVLHLTLMESPAAYESMNLGDEKIDDA